MKKTAASPACNVEGRQHGPITHSLIGAADKGKGAAGNGKRKPMPVNVAQRAGQSRGEAHPVVPIPSLPPPAPCFGDPVSIAARGIKPKRSRKSREAYLKPERPHTPVRYQPIWQRIEGEWKRYRCRDCNSAAFVVIDQEGAIVNVKCSVGHDGHVLSGFAMSKPDG
jgi:hypothetical protein